MDLSHAALQFLCELASAQVDVQHRGLHTPVTCEYCNLVNVPTGAGEIRQAEMTECMGREAAHSGTISDALDYLGPGPDRDGFASITSGGRNEQRSTHSAQRATFVEVRGEQLTRRR